MTAFMYVDIELVYLYIYLDRPQGITISLISCTLNEYIGNKEI